MSVRDRTAPWLTIIGIGEDGVAGLSPAAAHCVASASLVVGGRRHLALAAPLVRGESLCWASPIDDTFPSLLARRGTPVCVLASGDPFHYGVGATLARLVPAEEIVCHPQPSAFSLAAARLGWALQDCTCVSLHGRSLEQIIPVLQPQRRILALAWDRTTPSKLAALLGGRGFGTSILTVCEALGGAHERVRATSAGAFDLDDIADLNTIALEPRAEPGARVRPCAPGLPDDWFEHDGQITKAPIRAVTLSALAPRPGERLWDIGAGSGSVSIEWLLSDLSTRAVAVERHPARGARIGRNAASWGVGERLTQVAGTAPACIGDLAPPDAIFIGGGATAPGLIEACRGALPPGGRLVVNAVTLESQQRLAADFSAHGGELITLAVATAEPIGAFHGLRPSMPVTQWRWVKR